jgi:hypothetical protein
MWLTEHLKRLTQNGIQPHFQLTGYAFRNLGAHGVKAYTWAAEPDVDWYWWWF